jgi:hypothetical protein
VRRLAAVGCFTALLVPLAPVLMCGSLVVPDVLANNRLRARFEHALYDHPLPLGRRVLERYSEFGLLEGNGNLGRCCCAARTELARPHPC